MKLLNQLEGRTIKYFDVVLQGVPDWVNHIATDANGEVWGYATQPGLNPKSMYWQEYGVSSKKLSVVDLEDMDWKSTLMTIC